MCQVSYKTWNDFKFAYDPDFSFSSEYVRRLIKDTGLNLHEDHWYKDSNKFKSIHFSLKKKDLKLVISSLFNWNRNKIIKKDDKILTIFNKKFQNNYFTVDLSIYEIPKGDVILIINNADFYHFTKNKLSKSNLLKKIINGEKLLKHFLDNIHNKTKFSIDIKPYPN